MQDQTHEEITLLDYWDVLWRKKKMLIALFAMAVILTMVISLLLPKYYKSETVIIASSSESGSLGAALSSIPLAGALAGTLGVTGISTPADKILVFLKSRTIAEMVIKRFDLMHVFYKNDWDAAKGAWKDPDDPPRMEEAVKYLVKNVVSFKKDKSGSVTVIVEWKDAKLAAEMANYYVTALTEVMKEKSINTTIQVVDRAVPAERKSRPKIKLNMALAGIVSLIVGVFIAFFLENLAKQKRQF